jgi:hypothetical protein
MAKVRKIKVIKQSDMKQASPKSNPRVKIAVAKKATRRMADTVGDWVAEVQDQKARKTLEAKAALKLLFGSADLNET